MSDDMDNRDSLDPTGSGSCGREDLRIALGALALDALDADEAREVRRHLADCPECQAEYSSFLGVKTLMDAGMVGGLVRSTRRPPVPDAARKRPAVGSGAGSGPGSVPRPHRRFALALAGAAASLVLVATGFFALGRQGGTSGTSGPLATGVTRVVTAHNAQGITASITFGDVAWGTAISTTMANVPPSYHCTLWVIPKNGGDRQSAGSWVATPSGDFTVQGAVGLKAADIDHFELELPYSPPWEIPLPASA